MEVSAMVRVLLLCFPLVLAAETERETPGELCKEVVTTLYPKWSAGEPRDRLRRVEVRNCRVASWGFLQIAAWKDSGTLPSLVVDTRRVTIVKAAMAGDVFVLETAGASSNVVQVVLYQGGEPKLVLDDAVKAYAQIELGWKKVSVILPGEGGTARVYEFPTGMN
jgi:hypothetical protein